MRKQDALRHTREQAEGLFVEVLEQLNGHNVEFETIPQVLEQYCAFFGFGCAFIYERDHTNAFFLRERFLGFPNAQLPEMFRLEDAFAGDEIDQLVHMPVLYMSSLEGAQPLQAKMAGLFSASTLLVVPIMDGEARVIGCVGMMDRRSDILMDDHDLQLVSTLFSVVGNRVKLRIYQRRLQYTQSTLTSIMDNTGIDIYVNDFDTHEILYVNKSMGAPYGGLEKMLGKKCYEALYDDKTEECEYCPKKKIIDEDGNPTKLYTWDYERPFDGSWFRVLSAAFRWVDGRLAHIISSVDITEGKKYELMVEQMAFMDMLTGIPNRRMLDKDFRAHLERLGPNEAATLVFLDLDNFKSVNDTMGHSVGDELLIQVAQFLAQTMAGLGKAYRHGGDEFILFVEDKDADLVALTDRILKKCHEGYDVFGKKLPCTASLGVAKYPTHGRSIDELLEASDRTMYRAKQRGKANAVFMEE